MPVCKSIPIFIVTGFLGAGKTTFLKELLPRLHSPGETIAVLMNEFGEVGIDGALIQDFHHLTELNKGSIFCVCVRDDFLAALETIAHFVSPTVLVIEATGIADPLELGSFINSPQLAEHYHVASTITIVDPLVFPKVVDSVRAVPRQVEAADLLIVNKGDLIDNEVRERIEHGVAAINPQAERYFTTGCQLPEAGWTTLLESRTKESAIVARSGESLPVRDPISSHRIVAGPYESMEQLVQYLSCFPVQILRAKGFVEIQGNVYVVQFVAGRYDIKAADTVRDMGTLTVIGALNAEVLKEQGYSVIPPKL